jgi:hypothetical protein
MGANGQENIETISGTPSTTGKRKASRKPATGKASKRAVAAAGPVVTPTEILFKELPNPYKPAQPPFIWIDHPQQNERLQGPTYVIRLGVGGADAVELSIDKASWTPCRLTSGYWWFDWENIARGKHTLIARMRTSSGTWYRTPPRTVEY